LIVKHRISDRVEIALSSDEMIDFQKTPRLAKNPGEMKYLFGIPALDYECGELSGASVLAEACARFPPYGARSVAFRRQAVARRLVAVSWVDLALLGF
jgi:hypothetical protein